MDKVSNQENPIVLKDLILLVQEFISYLFKRWYIIFGLMLILGGFFFYKHITSELKYKSELRFVVEGQNGTGGGLGGLLGSIGIRKSGGVSPFKIIEVGRSSSVFLKVISTKMDDGQLLGNKIIDVYELQDAWEKSNSNLKGFYFTDDFLTRETTLKERKAIRTLLKKFWSKDTEVALCSFNLNEEKGIYNITSKTINEDLSYEISTTLYQYIKDFFEEDIFINQKQFTEILTAKADSLKVLRDSKIRQLARFNSKNLGLVNTETSAEITILNSEQAVLNVALSEVVKNKEMADVNLKDIQPLFLAIDSPFKPLPVITSSLMMSLIMGAFIGFMLGVVILCVIKIYKDAMA